MGRNHSAPRSAAATALAALALAACAAPAPPRPGPSAGGEAAFGAGLPADHARALEERNRGIGIPPSLPAPGSVDRLPGALRAAQPAPAVGPSGSEASGLPVPANALSRLSALPASPLANPPGGFASPGRP